MSTGIRTGFKRFVPVQLWPFFRFFDRYLIWLLYVYFAIKRFLTTRWLKQANYPKQSIPVFSSTIDFGSSGSGSLVSRIEKAHLQYESGRHSIYIDDPDGINHINPEILKRYSWPVGLKIIKSNEISADSTPYYTSHRLAPASTWFSMYAVGSILEKIVISNLLHEEGLAPKVYDLIKLVSEDGGWQYGLIVQPIRGEVVTGEAGMSFVSSFKDAMVKMDMQTISIKEHCDLQPPEFRHNIVKDSSGIYYVDIQNFVMFSNLTEARVMKEMACNGRESKSQKNMKHKRHAKPAKNLPAYLSDNGIDIQIATILDCLLPNEFLCLNLLAGGAKWIDLLRPAGIVSVVRQYLYLQGCTRFNVLSEDVITESYKAPFKRHYDLAFTTVGEGASIYGLLDEVSVSRFVFVGNKCQGSESLKDEIKKLGIPLHILSVQDVGLSKVEIFPIALVDLT